MARITPEQVETLHYLLNQASNAATAIADALATFGDLDDEDPEPEMALRVKTTKALQVRDSLFSLLASLSDDPS